MIGDKAAAQAADGFDPMFTAAGDDVDFSWRLAERELTIASAPAAVVIHERRPTLAAYVEQQRGYGRGEGLLFRKYPLKAGSASVMYGGGPWLSSLFGGTRIYYGTFAGGGNRTGGRTDPEGSAIEKPRTGCGALSTVGVVSSQPVQRICQPPPMPL